MKNKYTIKKKRKQNKIIKKQIGGWNESICKNFKEEAIKENDRLKQNYEWWGELKEELEYYADEMSEEFMGESRFEGMPMGQVQDSLDLINILGIDIAQRYARIINGPINDIKLIEKLNIRTLRLKDIVNIDFVEFIQILIEFIKSGEHYGELNEVKYENSDLSGTGLIESGMWITEENGPLRLSQIILNYGSNQTNHYELYKNGLMNSVKLLEIFLLKAYTGEYGELQARDIVCKDYFLDTIEIRGDTINKGL